MLCRKWCVLSAMLLLVVGLTLTGRGWSSDADAVSEGDEPDGEGVKTVMETTTEVAVEAETTGLRSFYTNVQSAFVLDGKSGKGLYVDPDKVIYMLNLKLQGKLTLKLRQNNRTKRGFLYESKRSDGARCYIFFGTDPVYDAAGRPLKIDGRTIYPLYYSGDKKKFTWWKTLGGTRKVDATDR